MSKRSLEPHPYVTSGEQFNGKKKILTGKKFGKLSVLGLPLGLKHSQTKWVCKCECGFHTLTFGFSLLSGESKSCGCVAAEKSRHRWKNPTEEMRKKLSDNSSHAKHRLSKHPLFRVWTDMKQRCFNRNNKFYFQYGGRGITVCERWMDFENFYQDMHATYERGLQIGRINNNGNYCPENCRWETRRQNQRNRSNTVYVETPLGRMLLLEASEIYGLTCACIKHRIKVGWPMDKTFLTPSERQKR